MVTRKTPESLATVALLAVFVLSIGGVVYFSVTTGNTGVEYTEFYVLGPDGDATNYPTSLSVGESGTVIVGLTNHEQASRTYTVVVRFEDSVVGQQRATVADGETWQQAFSVTPESPGRKRLSFLLYEGEPGPTPGEPYRTNGLMINVTAADTPA